MTDQDSIRNLQKKYNEAMNTGDLNLYRDTMAEDVILIAPDHPPIRGKDGAADWIKGDFQHEEILIGCLINLIRS